MKLSQLEALVKKLRQDAIINGNDDPNVVFWDSNRAEFIKALESKECFLEMDIHPSVLEDNIKEHRCIMDSPPGFGSTKNGDYDLPMTIIKSK